MNALTAIRPTFPSLSAAGVPKMAAGITPPTGLREIVKPSGITGVGESQAPGSTFANMLGKMVTEVSAKQSAAGQAVVGLQTNQGVTVHQAMIAMEEASVSFQLMAEVRNKMLESYQELMRMQV